MGVRGLRKLGGGGMGYVDYVSWGGGVWGYVDYVSWGRVWGTWIT